MSEVAAITPMTVSVQVLVVDGSRRMSWKFFEQIPWAPGLVDDANEDGDIVPFDFGNDCVAEVWGWVADSGHRYSGVTLIGKDAWTKQLIRQRVESGHWHSLKHDYPQLYIGG